MAACIGSQSESQYGRLVTRPLPSLFPQETGTLAAIPGSLHKASEPPCPPAAEASFLSALSYQALGARGSRFWHRLEQGRPTARTGKSRGQPLANSSPPSGSNQAWIYSPEASFPFRLEGRLGRRRMGARLMISQGEDQPRGPPVALRPAACGHPACLETGFAEELKSLFDRGLIEERTGPNGEPGFYPTPLGWLVRRHEMTSAGAA
jgi:hypothetical protein